MQGLFDYGAGLPYEQAGVLASRGDERVTFVPGRANQPVLTPEETLQLAFEVPNASNVVISRGKQLITCVAPLDRADEVIRVLA